MVIGSFLVLRTFFDKHPQKSAKLRNFQLFLHQSILHHKSKIYVCEEPTMTTLKQYAKRAKERMKNGFWEQAKTQLAHEKQVAATLGISPHKVAEEQHRKLQRQIYDYDGFCEEQEFYNKVVQILTSEQTISNPIMRLADQTYMAKLTPEQKQTYVQKLATKYRSAVERYNSLNS